MEDDVVAALLTVRQEGYQAGLDWMLNGKEGVDVEALQAARQEGYRAGFNNRATWDTLPASSD